MIQESVYETLCPPLGCLRMALLDSPVQAQNRDAYERDGSFFSDNPQRRFNIRMAADCEFDPKLETQAWLLIPHLWVLVIRLAIGVHLRLPTYRGKQFWTVPTTDNEAATIIQEMMRRGGIDLNQWLAFEMNCRRSIALPDGGRTN